MKVLLAIVIALLSLTNAEDEIKIKSVANATVEIKHAEEHFEMLDTNGDLILTEGSSPCTKMHGKIREIGASITFSKCSLSPEHFIDHTCNTLENLTAINCKRSQWEPRKIDGKEISKGDSWKSPGQRETCKKFNGLISCEGGYCKNVSKVYDCTFKDALESLIEPHGTRGQNDGWCNCKRCTESNGTSHFNQDGKLTCPKATEYCMLPPERYKEMRALGRISEEKLGEICSGPVYCQTCLDVCISQNDCLNMQSRQDVIKFGVDDKKEPQPLKTYYNCRMGNCTKVTELKCNRTCNDMRFDMKNSKIILLQGERVVMADCQKAAINDTEELPAASKINPKQWNKMMMSCSAVTVHPDEDRRSYIQAADCVNGTWMEDLNPQESGTVDYNDLTKKYLEVRSNPERWIKRRQDDCYNLVPREEDITIYNHEEMEVSEAKRSTVLENADTNRNKKLELSEFKCHMDKIKNEETASIHCSAPSLTVALSMLMFMLMVMIVCVQLPYSLD